MKLIRLLRDGDYGFEVKDCIFIQAKIIDNGDTALVPGSEMIRITGDYSYRMSGEYPFRYDDYELVDEIVDEPISLAEFARLLNNRVFLASEAEMSAMSEKSFRLEFEGKVTNIKFDAISYDYITRAIDKILEA